ncbi:V-type ATP synthase subunit A [Methanogenium organophilum]|uniref:A-type ATP synthase subunit A n=1 Tax=Methanogenium organophilum TaxID=2199 RepID=A0A9X9T7R0_METOG|nr:V-type ATP synthase subunit A [Methanogenium organophilum]WAI01658.1 V-type ATP synthase subunit A [Methanogenium organophilum]
MTGNIIRITGPVVEADGMRGALMYEVVHVGKTALIGEIIGLSEDVATIQVYEDTIGLTPGAPVERTGAPLSVELGPGLLGMVYDGIQRPLEMIREGMGDFIVRGASFPALDRDRKYAFTPTSKSSTAATPGTVIGTVQEGRFTHSILVPHGIEGTFVSVADAGEYTVTDGIAIVLTVEGKEEPVTMIRRWPVREERPVAEKLKPGAPLFTGQRVIDSFFPIVKGGTAAVPGPFGAGKTVVQHQLAKWSDADIIIYVGCGERGNELADVLRQFPALTDPKSGVPLMERTVLIGNTSNMPVAAREASVYTGITIAEYYRDMGYDVALMADSTSRWAEAMREISGRLEEMPGEHGYPAYLASRLAGFYERAGHVTVLGPSGREGSVSVIGAVSPPGGDFSEPVTQNTLRVVRVFWALDADLAHERHFPAVDWLTSYSLYPDDVEAWWNENAGNQWGDMRSTMMAILQKESELEEIVQLVGPDVLPEEDKLSLHIAEYVRESFLVQYAFDPVDTFCPFEKQYMMMQLITEYARYGREAVMNGVSVSVITALPVGQRLKRLGAVPNADFKTYFEETLCEMKDAFHRLEGGTV